VSTSLRFDLSGFNVTVRGADTPCAAIVREVWGLFEGSGGVPLIDIDVCFAGPELPPGPIDDSPLERTIAGAAIEFRSPEGRISIDASGTGRAHVATGNPAKRAFALINLIIPVLAWRLPAHDAAILHSGAVLVGERGFLLLGQAGAGKSTFVTHAIAAGARAVSEDLNLVVFEGDRCCLAGSPLRTRVHRGPGPGRWPLAALLVPDHGDPAALDAVPRLLASAQLQANLPFVGDCWMQVPGGPALTRRLDSVAVKRLRFAPDSSFVALLEQWPGGDR
jgi:hypothetical protein